MRGRVAFVLPLVVGALLGLACDGVSGSGGQGGGATTATTTASTTPTGTTTTTTTSASTGSGTCPMGLADCDDDASNGCEANVATDPARCGACDAPCAAGPNAVAGCSGGTCTIDHCDVGFDDCNGGYFDGCEASLSSDPNNCLACGLACALPNATAACQSGCVFAACDPGFEDCDGVPDNGCEVDLSSNPLACGACSFACPVLANATPSCAQFTCGLGSCDAGFEDCNGAYADGCEADTTSDEAHCAGCSPCPAVAHGIAACVMSACVIGQCAAPFDDCNMDGSMPASDGCEVNTDTDAAHCGGCGAPCAAFPQASAACVGGSCVLGACDAGAGSCDGLAQNGCETSLLADANNCGGCGVKCHSGTCSNGACACESTVLVIKDGSDLGSQTLANALGAMGFVVTVSPTPVYQYNGTNPSPAGFGAVVVLAGGPPGSPALTSDMPFAGQTALVNHVNVAGGGVVLTEWAALHVASGRWSTLGGLSLLEREDGYVGQVTYSVEPAFAAHPLWAGLPPTFVVGGGSNVGLSTTSPNVLRVATSPQAVDAVAARDTPVGRVVHVTHAGNYTANGWTNVNMQKLVANAVGWVARCD